MPIDARNAIRRWTNMSNRPEYYSGRGPNPGDLSPQQLFQIHAGLKAEVSAEAAEAFVSFVESLQNLSATNFLNQFYWFVDHGCQPVAPLAESDLDVGPDDGGQYIRALGSIVECLSRGSSRSDSASDSIKQGFLWKLGIRRSAAGARPCPYDGRYMQYGGWDE